jgi:hypothetical protein
VANQSADRRSEYKHIRIVAGSKRSSQADISDGRTEYGPNQGLVNHVNCRPATCTAAGLGRSSLIVAHRVIIPTRAKNLSVAAVPPVRPRFWLLSLRAGELPMVGT